MGEPRQDSLSVESTLEEIAQAAARFLDSKRAEDIKIINVRDVLQICTYFIIASGTSSRHLQTLSDGIRRLMKPLGLEKLGIEGHREGRWVCLDYSEIVVHLFERDSRGFYDFDHLWGDAPEVPFDPVSEDEREVAP